MKDKNEIIELESEEVTDQQLAIEMNDNVRKYTIKIHSKPKKPRNFTWAELEQLDELYNEIEEEDELS